MSGIRDGEAPRESARGPREARLVAAVNTLMAGPQGRAFLRWLLSACRCFEAELPAGGTGGLAERLIFAGGARQVGMQVLRLLEAADPAHFPKLLLTREDDDGPDGSGNA